MLVLLLNHALDLVQLRESQVQALLYSHGGIAHVMDNHLHELLVPLDLPLKIFDLAVTIATDILNAEPKVSNRYTVNRTHALNLLWCDVQVLLSALSSCSNLAFLARTLGFLFFSEHVIDEHVVLVDVCAVDKHFEIRP